MEFYNRQRLCWCRLERFNSQRDGILQQCQVCFQGEVWEFQFPTGWNSTSSGILGILDAAGFNSQRDGILQQISQAAQQKDARFNSQRDGILRDWGNEAKELKIVSIPNGMEFYTHMSILEIAIDIVSIPNGMEFYADKAHF